MFKVGEYFRITTQLGVDEINRYGLPPRQLIKDVIFKVRHTGNMGFTNHDIDAISFQPKHPTWHLQFPEGRGYAERVPEQEMEKILQRMSWFKMYKPLDISEHPKTNIFK